MVSCVARFPVVDAEKSGGDSVFHLPDSLDDVSFTKGQFEHFFVDEFSKQFRRCVLSTSVLLGVLEPNLENTSVSFRPEESMKKVES